MSSLWFGTGAVAAGIGVALGAFGAHGLRGRLSAELMQTYQTGVQYHLIHALALLAVGWAAARWTGKVNPAASWSLNPMQTCRTRSVISSNDAAIAFW